MKTNMTSKSEELALDYEKSEDPAKMTYSIQVGWCLAGTLSALPRALRKLL